MIPSREHFYIAAPFFNPPQLQLVKDIESRMVHADVGFFSPRMLDENEKGPINPAAAASIFRKDIAGIITSTAILAVVDWKLPEGDQIRVCRADGDGELQIVSMPPLNIPDSGTVFEMGASFMRSFMSQAYRQTEAFDPIRVIDAAMEKLHGKYKDQLMEVRQMLEHVRSMLRPMKLVVYTERPPETGLNLMLTQGAVGVVNGLEELEAFLGKSGEPRWETLKPWTGKNR